MAYDMEISADPLADLAVLIGKAAEARETLDQSRRNDQAAREQQRDEARSAWANHSKALPAIVDRIDKLLTQNGFIGLAIVPTEGKHSDIDRVVIEFAHGIRDHTKIQINITQGGEFVCSVGQVFDEADKYRLPVRDLRAVDIQHALAQAVARCIERKRVS